MTSPLSEIETKLLEVTQNFHTRTSVLLAKIYDCDAAWGKEEGYTRDYWLSDVEMVPHLATTHLATISLAVKGEEREKLLVGPAVGLYKMYEKPDMKQYFDACFEVLEEMEKIPNDGLHDNVPGLTRIRINYQSIMREAAYHPVLRWLGTTDGN